MAGEGEHSTWLVGYEPGWEIQPSLRSNDSERSSPFHKKNISKHQPYSITRMLTTGHSDRQRLIIVAHTDRDERIRIISARDVTRPSVGTMKKNRSNPQADDMRPEYDLRGGVRGKYYERYKQGTNVVLLEPAVAKVFRDSATVNEALRRYLSEHGTPPSVTEKAG